MSRKDCLGGSHGPASAIDLRVGLHTGRAAHTSKGLHR